MKKLLIIITSFICLETSAGPTVSGGVPMAPWTRSAATFSSVLRYLNEAHLDVDSLAFVDGGAFVKAEVICQDRRPAILIFNISHGAREVQVTLNSERSQTCR